MQSYKVISGQNIIDLAVQLYGDASKVPQLLEDNENLDINVDIVPGTVILYTPTDTPTTALFASSRDAVATQERQSADGKAFDESFDNSFN